MFRKEFGRIVGEQRGYIERIRDWGRGVNNWVEGLFFSSVGTALGIALTKSIDRVDSVGLGDISLSKMTGLLPE